ncbi:hypothetical protein [Novosphingobium sp.]|uniref:hypothetical protein n=1 Tax=Novosphingobium sp. TaxID=1874826 RepID=UPI003D1273E9
MAIAISIGLAAAPAVADPAQLPDRLLTCSIGHITNFDPHIEQTPDQLTFDGHHAFTLFLPGIPALVGRPPDAAEDAPPVDPRTRIVHDPDHISGQPSSQFGRIVDMWPDRVELSATIEGPLLNMIVVHPVDIEHGTASLFMMRATELTHYQPEHFYQGTCRIVTGKMAHEAMRRPA